MPKPLFVRALTDGERAALEAGLRSRDAFTLRRCQVLLASAAGHPPARIAERLACASQTVRNAVRAFNARGLDCLSAGSSRPRSAQPVLTEGKRERLRAILHQGPRAFGKARSTWTLGLLAEVAHEQGLSDTVLSAPTLLDAVRRLGVGLEAGQAPDQQPGPGLRAKKSGATG